MTFAMEPSAFVTRVVADATTRLVSASTASTSAFLLLLQPHQHVGCQGHALQNTLMPSHLLCQPYLLVLVILENCCLIGSFVTSLVRILDKPVRAVLQGTSIRLPS